MTTLKYPSVSTISGASYTTAMDSWSPNTNAVHYHPQNAIEYTYKGDGKVYQLFSYKDTVTGYVKLKRREKGSTGAWTTLNFGTTAWTQIPKFYVKPTTLHNYLFAIYAINNEIYYSSSLDNGVTWGEYNGYSATASTFVMIVSVTYNTANNIATVHFVEGTGAGTGSENYKIIKYNTVTGVWDLKVTTTVDSTADTNFQYTCPGYYSQSEGRYYGLLRYNSKVYRFTYNDNGTAIISPTLVGDGTYYISKGNFYPVMKKCDRLTYGLYKPSTYHLVKVWDLTIYSTPSEYSASESTEIIHGDQQVFEHDTYPFKLAIDRTNERILLWDEWHPLFYHVSDYSGSFGIPIACFGDTIITTTEIVYMIDNTIITNEVDITNTTFILGTYTNIDTTVNKYIMLIDDTDKVVARCLINKITNEDSYQELELENLNYRYIDFKCTLDNTDDLGTQLIRCINQINPISAYIIDVTGSNYTFKTEFATIETMANTIEMIGGGKVSLYPDGRVTYYKSSYPSSGITLSSANGNIIPLIETVFNSEYSEINFHGGYYDGERIELLDSDNLGSDAVTYDIHCPLVVDSDALSDSYTLLKSQQGSKCIEFECQYYGTTELLQGQSVTVDITDIVSSFPEVGASSITMYVDYVDYEPILDNYNVVLVNDFIYRRLLDGTINMGQQIESLADDSQQNGNIHLPYFQATNYNTPSSTWVSQACADNTVTPLNLYNIVKNEGGWTWSSSARTKVYVPTAGWYLFQARVQFAGNTSGTRRANLRIDGINADAHMVSQFLTQGSGDTIVNATGMGYVSAGSYVECCGLQDTSPGVSLDMKYMAFNIVRLSR